MEKNACFRLCSAPEAAFPKEEQGGADRLCENADGSEGKPSGRAGFTICVYSDGERNRRYIFFAERNEIPEES